jgi:hypothetical protein
VPVAVHEIPETGRQFDLVADERSRAAVARAAGVAALPRLQASLHVTRHGMEGLHVVGIVSATVGQTCVVTLDPIESEIEEAIDVVFSPAAASAAAKAEDLGEIEVAVEDAPEPLIGGLVDLGHLATEFLILGIDPYPRKPGAVFEPPAAGDDKSHPFAALAALRKGQSPKDE